MADALIAYNASASITCTLASLASSATFVAGRASAAYDNTSNLDLDVLLSGKVTVGTTPTVNTEIHIDVLGMLDDSTWPDVFDGTDSAETVTSAGMSKGYLRRAATLIVDATTSDRTYNFGPISVAQLFGGTLPPKFQVFVTHNTGVNLNSTPANHALNAKAVYQTVA